MAYEKQTWENLPSQTTPINADRLTHIEDGIFNAASTADTAASDASSAISGLADKVDKVEGKGLSTNDFTDALKTKLDGIATGAEVNVQADYAQTNTEADDYIKNKPSLGTASAKNSTSVVTDSSDLVESGAVYDVLGWSGINYLDKSNRQTYNATATDTSTGINISCTNKANANAYLNFNDLGLNKQYKISADVDYTSGSGAIVVLGSSDGATYSNVIDSVENITTDGKRELSFNTGSYPYIRISLFVTRTTAQDGNISFNELMLYDAIYIEPAFEPYHESVEQTLRDAEVVQGKNLLPNNATSQTVNGVTFTVNSDLSVTANGTATANIYYTINRSIDIKSNTIVSGCPSGGSSDGYSLIVANSDGTSTYGIDTGDGVAINSDYTNAWVFIRIRSGVTVSNKVFYPMISAEGGAYEPYYVPLKDVVPNKCDNSVIAPVENQPTCQKNGGYAVGEHFIRDGAFCTCIQAIAQGGTFTLNTNYTAGDVASELEVKDLTSSITINTDAVNSSTSTVHKQGNVVSVMFNISLKNIDSGVSPNIVTGFPPSLSNSYVYLAKVDGTGGIMLYITKLGILAKLTASVAITAGTYYGTVSYLAK